MAINPERGYEFAVYFYKKASTIKVYDEHGEEVHGEELTSRSPLNNVSKLDTLQVVHKVKPNPGSDPCCVVWDNEKYCWC